MELFVAGEITEVDLYLTGKKYSAIIDEIIIAKTCCRYIKLKSKAKSNKPWILKMNINFIFY